VAAGVGRLLVDGGVDQADQRLEQRLQLLDQQPVVEAIAACEASDSTSCWSECENARTLPSASWR
jgi:hypothetical protein